MGAVLSSVQGTLIFGVVLVGLYRLYCAALPKPLPNIPYNRDAANKLFGDVPEMMAYVMRTKRIFVSPRAFCVPLCIWTASFNAGRQKETPVTVRREQFKMITLTTMSTLEVAYMANQCLVVTSSDSAG